MLIYLKIKKEISSPSLFLLLILIDMEAFARFEAFTAVTFQVMVFWVVTPCSVVVGYQCF
jgi:hypothetical protein